MLVSFFGYMTSHGMLLGQKVKASSIEDDKNSKCDMIFSENL